MDWFLYDIGLRHERVKFKTSFTKADTLQWSPTLQLPVELWKTETADL